MASSLPITNPPLVCWNCHERTVGTHFCPGCGKVLQVPEHSDYFLMFEMPRKLWIEMGALEQKFLQLSWKLHPDNFVNATPELLEEVFELNESLDELREAKSSGGDTAALKHRLDAAEKNFEQKLTEVDGQLQGAAREWDKALDDQ